MPCSDAHGGRAIPRAGRDVAPERCPYGGAGLVVRDLRPKPRDAAVLPCTTTDYGSGFVTTNCDGVRVDLVHPADPASVDTDHVFPDDTGAGSGSLQLYGFMLKGFGAHTLRATNTETGEAVTETVVLKALTRTGASFSERRRRRPPRLCV